MIPRTISAAERKEHWPLGLNWFQWIYSRPEEVWKGRGPTRRKEVMYVHADWSNVRVTFGLSLTAGALFELRVAAAVAFSLTAGLWLRRFTEQLYESKMVSEAILQKEWNSLIKNVSETYAYKARMEGS